jgi:2-hydroxychromene-2-carboxylate isomerase
MPLEFDLYFSFRSPYSYLAVPRIRALTRDWDVDVNIRVVLPLAVRSSDFFEKVNPLWPPYLLRDVTRIAEFLGMKLHWPRPDPVVQEFPSRKVAEEQPYIHRISRLGAAAAETAHAVDFLYEVSQIIWNGETMDWHEGDHLTRASARAGVDLVSLEARVNADPAAYDAAIEANQRALEEAGHWGVPTMVFRGEPFFGQDRIELLQWRLEGAGLQRR